MCCLQLEKKKRILLRDITRFVSKTRLCIHNIPADVDDKKLRAICKAAVPAGDIVEVSAILYCISLVTNVNLIVAPYHEEQERSDQEIRQIERLRIC